MEENTNESVCEICGKVIHLDSDGWMESDTGDVCAECVDDAKGHDEK